MRARPFARGALGIRGRTAIVFALAFFVLAGVVLFAVNLLTGFGISLQTPRLVAEPSGVTAPHGARLGISLDIVARQQLLLWSVVGLSVTTALSALVGWILAGRLLRPIARVTDAAGRISVRDLHQRIALSGPHDELRSLADTFDQLLARLEGSFESQKRFIANASHELRTPLALQRTALQVGFQSDDPESVRRTAGFLLEANRRSERLITSLLTLATSEGELRDPAAVALHDIVREEVASRQAEASSRSITLACRVDPCTTMGDAVLLGQLVGNLLANALEYNRDGGTVDVHLTALSLVVANSGPDVAADDIHGLFQPFRRGGVERLSASGHSGLGLSIVAAVARTHGMAVAARPGDDGGLVIELAIPSSAPDSSSSAS